jgi:transcriptional regulator with XRE-family HTH domain
MKLSRTAMGLAVRAARDAAKLTASDLAMHAQIERSALSRTENGIRALEFAEAVAIASVLNIDVETLRTLAETFEREGVAQKREMQKTLQADLVRLQRLAIETAIDLSTQN